MIDRRKKRAEVGMESVENEGRRRGLCKKRENTTEARSNIYVWLNVSKILK